MLNLLTKRNRRSIAMALVFVRALASAPARPSAAVFLLGFIFAAIGYGGTESIAQDSVGDRPNIVWVMSEDNSIHYLKMFADGGAATPAIESLAAEGVTFTHAYSCAPVCSVARTTLITSCFAPRLGTQYHRRSTMVELPDDLLMFPAYLRQAGYHTSNNSKEDYNALGTKEAWNKSGRNATWRERGAPSTPFFHVRTLTGSHESSLHFPSSQLATATEHDPALMQLPSYLPDTQLSRYTFARYLDRISDIDEGVAAIIAELKADGVWENTILFYFGDHGGVLPRSKGYVYDSGTHVPLVIRIPERYRKSWGIDAGSRDDRFVQFVDFGPTVLSMASVDVPSGVDGKAFLGNKVDSTAKFDTAFSYADRFDEKSDLVRSLHRGRWHYIRNYQAFLPDSLWNQYRFKMLAYAEWREMFEQGKLNAVQSAFFRPRPTEMLFDLSQDPHEVNNLAADPEYRDVLQQLRHELHDRVVGLPDLSFIPEHESIPAAASDSREYGQRQAARIARLVAAADLSLQDFEQADEQWKQAISSDDPWEVYWGLTAAACRAEEVPDDWVVLAQAHLDAKEPLVRGRAAVFLALATGADPRPNLLAAIAAARNEWEALALMNELVFVADNFEGRFPVQARQIKTPFHQNEMARRLEYFTD